MARRDDREYREYLSEEQRSQRGCIGRRMQPDFHRGLLGNLADDRARVVAQDLAHTVNLQRLVEVDALAELARELLQPRQLIFRLDSLGRDVHREAGGEREDRTNDFEVAGIIDAADERPIDLQSLHGETRKITQRRITDAE